MKLTTKRFICVLLTVILCIQFVYTAYADSEAYYRYQGLSNVFLSSTISNGDIDSAIELGGNTMYIPAGTYVIKKPIVIDSGTIIGAGMDKTIIVADFENPKQPIILAGSTPVIKNIQFRYKDGLVTGKETNGERAGLFCTNYWALQKGAAIQNVKFANVGTGMYSPGTVTRDTVGMTGVGETGTKEYDCQAFSVDFNNIVIEDFSYRGVDFDARLRTGNIWRNIYISSGKYACNSAFYFEGEESECSIDLLTVADTRAEMPIVIIGARAVDAGSVALRNVSLINEKTDYIRWSESSGYIRHLSLNGTAVSSLQNIVKIGSTAFIGDYPEMNYLHIGALTLAGVSGMTFADKFYYFARENENVDPFYVTVDEYYYDADQLEKEIYRNFPTSEENLIYTKKGQISLSGSTLLRPQNRLCPYYTKYDDTELGKTVTWTGEEWK